VVIGAVGTGGGLVLGLTVALLLEKYRLIAARSERVLHRSSAGGHSSSTCGMIVVASLAGRRARHAVPVAKQAAKLYPVEAIRHE
jgi:lipoprotein-releasing system permease protein